jgi:hypothetical protein
MRRKLWTAVLITVVLMVIAGNLPGRLPSSWLVVSSALWDGIVARAPALWDGIVVAGSTLRGDLAARLPALVLALQTPAFAVGAAAILAALTGALFALALSCRCRDPFKSAVREMRGGRHVAGVARRTRLAQDAVRMLLHPDRAERGRPRRRREEPSVPEGLTLRKGRGQTPVANGMRWVESS